MGVKKRNIDISSILLLAALAFYILAPLAVMIMHSIATEWYVLKRWWAPSKIGLDWYYFLFRDPDLFRSLWMTYVIAITVVIFTIGIFILPAYVIGTGKVKKGADFIETLGNLPQAIPIVVLGIGLLPIYGRLGLLYTFPGIVIAHSIPAAPYVFRTLVSGFIAIPPEIEEAARVLGAGKLAIVFNIYIPLLKPSILAAAVLAFSASINEYVLTAFLGVPAITTLAVRVYQTAGGYYWSPHLAGAFSIFMIIPSVTIVMAIEKITRTKVTPL